MIDTAGSVMQPPAPPTRMQFVSHLYAAALDQELFENRAVLRS